MQPAVILGRTYGLGLDVNGIFAALRARFGLSAVNV